MRYYLFLLLFCLASCNGTEDMPGTGEEGPFDMTLDEICSTEFDVTASFNENNFFGTWVLQKTVKCFIDTAEIAYDINIDDFEHHHEFMGDSAAYAIHTFEKGKTDTLGVLDGIFFDANAFPKFNYDIFEPGQPRDYPETGEILKLVGDDALFLWQPCAQSDFCGEYQVYLYKRLN